MATNLQRFKAIGDALLDGDATNQQLERVAAAFINRYNVQANTNEEKAGVPIRFIKRYVRSVISTEDSSIEQAKEALETIREDCRQAVRDAEQVLTDAINAANQDANNEWPDDEEGEES